MDNNNKKIQNLNFRIETFNTGIRVFDHDIRELYFVLLHLKVSFNFISNSQRPVLFIKTANIYLFVLLTIQVSGRLGLTHLGAD